MGVISAALKHMIAAGMAPDAIIQAVEEMEANNAPAKTARQERNARYYQRKASEKRLKASYSDVSDAKRLNSDASRDPARVEDITSTQRDTKTKKTRNARDDEDLVAFKAELADLDTDRLEALVKHRRSKKGQMTGLSARLFRKDADACSLSLPEAVDACISRNWITVKPEYFRGRSQGPPPAHSRTAFTDLLRAHRGAHAPSTPDTDPRSSVLDFPLAIAGRNG